MFDFIRKAELWDALDRGWRRKLGGKQQFHLKTIQDLAVYRRLADCESKEVAEVGGGDSRLLRALAPKNRCVNMEKFDGTDGGPRKPVRISGVQNIPAYLGEFDARAPSNSFDVVFSISVVEHVPTPKLADFLADGLRLLRPGGLWLHAIDMYLEDETPRHVLNRFEIYRSWAKQHGVLDPVGAIYGGPPNFACDMASNPDNVLYEWGAVAPAQTERRQRSQSVSLLVGARKI